MPAKKPQSLNKRHSTKTERQQRADHEAALTPKSSLKIEPPAQLSGTVARDTWTETMALYFALDARIVSVLDRGLLVDYCTTTDQLAEIDDLRAKAMSNYIKSQKSLDKVLEGKKKNPDTINPKELLQLINAVNWQMDEIIKLDSRADRKRALLHTMRQSLYLTPRSRAMMVPPDKAPEPPQSAMAKILDG
jgi:hypothetical protein